MQPIKNLKKGSRLDVYVMVDDKVRQVEAELTDNPNVLSLPSEGEIRCVLWADVGSTPREAIALQIKRYNKEISELRTKILDLEFYQRRQFPGITVDGKSSLF